MLVLVKTAFVDIRSVKTSYFNEEN